MGGKVTTKKAIKNSCLFKPNILPILNPFKPYFKAQKTAIELIAPANDNLNLFISQFPIVSAVSAHDLLAISTRTKPQLTAKLTWPLC
jgi:hypothetical protein